MIAEREESVKDYGPFLNVYEALRMIDRALSARSVLVIAVVLTFQPSPDARP
jgi:hypothetical protein